MTGWLAAVRQFLRGERRAIVIVVPTQHLKRQWADAATRFGLHLEPEWNAGMGLPADMHGVWAGLTPRQLAAEQRARGIKAIRPTLAAMWGDKQ